MTDHRIVRCSVLAFGPFCLLPRERRLEREGTEVKIGSRALDILITLTECAGEVVSKEDLTARVWPDTTVHESGLRVHIGALRKALADKQGGARYVINVPGRGYCFVAEVVRSTALDPPSDAAVIAQIGRRLDGIARAIGLSEGRPGQTVVVRFSDASSGLPLVER